MVTTIINRATRGDQEWLYVDTGVFHGLIEGLEMFDFPYNVLSERTGDAPLIPYTVCGPTCDSADIIRSGIQLPANLTLGDRLFFFPAGAYSNSLEQYNGMTFPDVLLAKNGNRDG